ncbi:hypothetical protein CONLIGDRAFT_642964 [Coniochaeta ligniaria NRRL 30616]|uniref:Uncharacterized protein n=1 Tax=Coniochaeta ligniaria NRRL 30616 TaxID=1408157 RepID=A0A1J7JNL8_9PEZI|nr:hypothetical protein CONLIGDRAFT_642964 [Coniochaeta ligniaria NRRL 30616]
MQGCPLPGLSWLVMLPLLYLDIPVSVTVVQTRKQCLLWGQGASKGLFWQNLTRARGHIFIVLHSDSPYPRDSDSSRNYTSWKLRLLRQTIYHNPYMTDTSNTYAQTDSRASIASILRARSCRQRLQRAKLVDMASNLSDPPPATPLVDREEAVDRSSRGSNTSVPSMVDDHGSDFSVDDDQYYRTSGEQIWDSFWQSGCEEEEEPAVSPSYQYPALVVPSLSLETRQFLTSRKRPTQTQSLSVIEAPAPADNRSADHASTRRRGHPPCRVSYSIFPPQDEVSRQRTIRARRCPPHLTLDTPKVRVSSEESRSLRTSASARSLRSGSASSAFSASSAYSASTDVSMASDVTAITTPAASPRESWDCPRTPKPTHVSQCMDFPRPAKQPSLPNLRGPSRYRPTQPRSATAQHFTEGEARNSAVVGAVAAEPYPRPLFSPAVVAPLQPTRRVPLPPVAERRPPPVYATRPIPPPRSTTRPVPAPLNLARPLPPLPPSASRPQTPMSAPPRPLRPDHHQPSATSFGPPLSPPRPPPFRTTSQPLPNKGQDFQPPVVSVFEWDSDADDDADDDVPSHSFAKRIARGFAQIQARNNNNNNQQQHKRSAASGGGDAGLTRIQSGETATRFHHHHHRPAQSRARALTVEDIRRVEQEDMEDRLRQAREQVARDRCSVVIVGGEVAQVLASPPPRQQPTKQKSAIFGRMLGWRTQ